MSEDQELEDEPNTKVRLSKEDQPEEPELRIASSKSDEAEDDTSSMAMIKEIQKEKCGSVENNQKTNDDNSTTNEHDGESPKPEPLEDESDIKTEVDENISEDVPEKEELVSVSPLVANEVVKEEDTMNSMEICADSKLDGAFINDALPSCKSQVKTDDIISADSSFPSDLLDSAISSCKSHKTDEELNSEPVFPPDSCDSMLSSICGSSDPLIDDIQPLPSNVISKQPTTIDAQYMQQQSQVFVFSTKLANESAASVQNGHYPSIIAYHCSQPQTKQYLEMHPLNINQFNRQNHAQWLNNLAQMKQKSASGSPNRCGIGRGNFRNNPMMNQCPSGIPPGMNMPPRLSMWNSQVNMNSANVNNTNSHMMPSMCNNNSVPNSGTSPAQSAMSSPGMSTMPLKCQSQTPPMLPDSTSSLMSNMLPSLGSFPDDNMPLSPHGAKTGMKIPDENLTPKQRMHREEGLARLSKIRSLLMPENNQSPHQPLSGELSPAVHTPVSVDDMSVLSNESTDANGFSKGDWQKMQFPSYDKGKKDSRSGPRSQGPPPPYHQTTRSASVPIASPNAHSPGTTTSNMSLPSPRACSAINSPASKRGGSPIGPNESPGNKHALSSPGTPAPPAHSSPKEAKQLGALSDEFSPTNSGESPDGIFCRSLQSLAQQQHKPQLSHGQQHPSNNKEPNLMPVPSPQHIQYLNTFEAQELTIQKQPNTSLKETSNIGSPSLSTAALDSILPSSDNSCSKVSVSAPTTPLTPSSIELGSSRYPGTPSEYAERSPGGGEVKPATTMRGNNCNMKGDLRYSCSSPQMADQARYQPASSNFMPQNKNSYVDVTSPEKMCSLMVESKDANNFPRMGPDNMPLNPAMNPATKSSPFDPISSLAQMSQQLTNNVPNSPGQPGGMMHSGMMPYNSGPLSNNMHMMPMNEMAMCGNVNSEPTMQDNSRIMYNPQMSMNMAMNNNMNSRMMCTNSNDAMSPKSAMMANPYMMGPNARMIPRNSNPMSNSYNGANIQVKPNAPNTIQYLPNRSQPAAGNPRMEFLPRYSNPMNIEGKMSHHNMYYAGGYGAAGNMDMMAMNCNMPPGNLIRGVRGNNPNMMRMGNPMGMPYNEQMYPPPPNANIPNNNCHMYNVASTKMPQMGMGVGVAPDATQPLPPSIGQSNNFKNSPFIGPTTADPNYAQQFHNFQQQLYATNSSRNQLNVQSMAANNQQYFVPK